MAVIAGGVFVFSLGEGLAGLAVGVLVVGVGFACLLPLTNRGVALWFPGQRRALAIGVKQGGVPTGIAPPVAFLPRLAVAEGWRPAARYLGLGVLVTGLACALSYCLLFRVRFPRLEGATALPETSSSGRPRPPAAARDAAGWDPLAVARWSWVSASWWFNARPRPSPCPTFFDLMRTEAGRVMMAAATINDLIGWPLFAVIVSKSVPDAVPATSPGATMILVLGLFVLTLSLGRRAG